LIVILIVFVVLAVLTHVVLLLLRLIPFDLLLVLSIIYLR
jgi:hypothetical protein